MTRSSSHAAPRSQNPLQEQDAVILGTFLEQTFHLGSESQVFFFLSPPKNNSAIDLELPRGTEGIQFLLPISELLFAKEGPINFH